PIVTGSLAPNPAYSANRTQILAFMFGAIWLIGIAVMLLYGLASYIWLKFKVRASVLDNGVFLCDNISTPFILGIIKPKIYLPSTINEGKQYIIDHEKAHIKRLDFLWKPLGFLILTVHWFNPVVWLAYSLFCKDLELCCDERIIKNADNAYIKEYSRTLLSCSTPKKYTFACPIAFGEVGVKQRIKMLLSYKKPAFWVILCGVLISALVAVCFLTNPTGVPITEIDTDDHTPNKLEVLEFIEVVSPASVSKINGGIGIIEKLERLRVQKNPISKSRAEDRDQTYKIKLDDRLEINFSADLKTVWFNNYVKPTFSYRILNPEVLEGIFDTSKAPVYDDYKSEQTVVYLDATVQEIEDSRILVAPIDEKIGSLISINVKVHTTDNLPLLKVGDKVRIAYDGYILETYPAMLGRFYGIELLEKEFLVETEK
ncbi:MAG: hypothetical protein IKK24_02495, partial [Clostridia bacterium]|nr:hypothetical protein [Clostridia bacterium]